MTRYRPLHLPVLYQTICALVLIVLTISRAVAEDHHSIAGVATERKSGEVIIGAAVMLFRDSTSTQHPLRGVITNKYGFFSLANVADGDYYLTVRALGYARTTKPVHVEGNSVRMDFKLEVESVGREVVVQAERNPAPTRSISSVEVKPEMLQHLPSLGGETDIFRSLQMLPGVKSASEVSSGLYVRGGSPDQNLTLLDGVIVYNPAHLAGFMSTFNADAIQDIRLIKGAFPAEYGGRLSSVLDLTMKEGAQDAVHGTAGLTLINSRLTLEGPITDGSTFMISGRRMYLDALMALAPRSETEDAPTYYFYDLNGKINYKLSERDRLYLSGYFGRDVFSTDASDSNYASLQWGNSTANVRWSHIVSPELFTNFSAIYTDYGFDALIEDRHTGYRDQANFKSISGVKDYMLRAEAQYFPDEDHTIKFGFEGTNHRFRADASAELEDFGRIDRNPTILNSLDLSLYGQDEWKITPLLFANLGTRFYYFQQGNYFRVEPRASLAYNVTENVQLTGAFSTSNQFLHLITRNDIALPTDVWFPSTSIIKPEAALQGVLGIQTHLFDNEYLFSIEGYYKSMKNLYEYKDTASLSIDVPLETSFTSGTGEAYGIEVFLNKQIGSFTGWLGYTLAWTKRLFPELNNGKEFYPRYDQRHDIQAVLTYRIGQSWEFGATWTYATGQAFTQPFGQYELDPSANGTGGNSRLDYTERNGYRVPAFHKLDLNFTHSYSWFGLPWSVSINIYNAYGHKNVFAQFLERDYTYSDGQYQGSAPYKIHRITLFGIIPTFGLSCKF